MSGLGFGSFWTFADFCSIPARNIPSDMAALSTAAQKRLLSDLKHLQEEPIPLAAAAPTDDLSLWNGVIGAQMEVTHIGFVTVPLHFLIDFPCDYPSSAPKIGFSFDFDYRNGASYVQSDGRLKGKKVICLDVLGNFDFVHTVACVALGCGSIYHVLGCVSHTHMLYYVYIISSNCIYCNT